MSFVPPQYVRPIAVCIIRRNNSIFVFEGRDSVKNQTFYRPLGGTIEFGELGAEAVAREFMEEIKADLINLKYVGTLENIFEYEGHPGHELVLVYEADFASPDLYETEETTGFGYSGEQFRAMWKPLSDFGPGGAALYPDGLIEFISTD